MENAAIEKAYCVLREKTDFRPVLGIILGSGLGGLAETVKAVKIVDYKEIDGFPQSTVEGHKGRFVFGYIEGVPVAVMQGRVHFYEGYPMEQVIMPVRLLKLMGIKALLLTNAAGGINPAFRVGTFMAITDHICAAPNPLIGPNQKSFGVRFPDMTEPYDSQLLKSMKRAAAESGIALSEGVYYQVTGPSYETPAEIKMMRVLGADAVGMSTAVETVAARHAGLRVAGLSVISDVAAAAGAPAITHEEILKALKTAETDFIRLVTGFVKNIKDDAII